MKIFGENEFKVFLQKRWKELETEILTEDRNALLNMNETAYVDYLVAKYCLDLPVLDFDHIAVSDREEIIPAGRFPRDRIDTSLRGGDPGQRIRQVFWYHIPFAGPSGLLGWRPSKGVRWTYEVTMTRTAVAFDVVNWCDSADEVRTEAKKMLGFIRQLADNLASDVTRFNDALHGRVTVAVTDRKAELLKQLGLLESLGVPIKASDQVPDTLAVPVQKTRPILAKPGAPTAAFTPEPTLEASAYAEILRICRDLGREIERLPSIHEGKDEESLRDHFLLLLSPHFSSATGETFNKTGKTDILIRHQGANLFVAECKNWGGPKAHLDGLDQLLGYLTWRDSKTALLCFVRNKKFGPVLAKIEETTPQHPCFVKLAAKPEEGRFDYDFHIPADPTRGVKLAILCFHFPRA